MSDTSEGGVEPQREALARAFFAETNPHESWDEFDERYAVRGCVYHPMQQKAFRLADIALASPTHQASDVSGLVEALEKISEGGPDIGPIGKPTYQHGFDQGCAWSGRIARPSPTGEAVIVALWTLICGWPVLIWFGYMLRLMHTDDGNPWRRVGAWEKIEGKTLLLRGEDGQLCEGRWVTSRKAAKEYGGRARDYYGAWIGWDDEPLEFTPVAFMPAYDLPQQVKND
jgi:hypothetical protein